MHMKYDYYNQTGVFKPGYNIQIGVSDEYILIADIFQNPGDSKTFMPFMETYKKQYNKLPVYPVGDAGYGSYDNYTYCVKNKMELSLKYNYFNKRNYDKKFRSKIYNQFNFEKDEDGVRICPAGHKFNILVGETKSKTTHYGKHDYLYSCGKCSECEQRKDCTKAVGNRKIKVNKKLDNYYAQVDELLTSELGTELRKQRSAQVEGAFGIIKQDFNYTRLHRRKRENVKAEILLICIGFNIRKFHNKKSRLKKS